MRGRYTLGMALALALAVPAMAQQDVQHDTHMGTATSATTMAPMPMLNEGTFVSHTPAEADRPGTVTLQFDWQGTPLWATFDVDPGQPWMSEGRPIAWTEVRAGTRITVPEEAKLLNISVRGMAGAGTVTAVDHQQGTVTLQLPSGVSRTLRFAPSAIFQHDNRLVSHAQLAQGQHVLFEVPQGQNQVVLFRDVMEGRQASIQAVGEGTLTVRTMVGGDQETRNYTVQQGTRFIHQGSPVMPAQFAQAFRQGQTIWIFGSVREPDFLLTDIDRGYESALVTTPPQPGVAVAPPDTTVVTTPSATVVTMPAVFSQGTFVSRTQAMGDIPPTATVRLDWNGTPLLATFVIRDEDRWMSQGQAVNWMEIREGSMLSIPAGTRLANITFGGRVGVGTITALDRVNNTMTVRLPTGETRVLRYSPQAIVVRDGQPVMISSALSMGADQTAVAGSRMTPGMENGTDDMTGVDNTGAYPSDEGTTDQPQSDISADEGTMDQQVAVGPDVQTTMAPSLSVGDTVLFEVVPQRNVVGLIMPVEPGMQATVSQVTGNEVTLRVVQDGQTRMVSVPVDEEFRVYHQGQLITRTQVATTLRPGQTVWIYGAPDRPEFIASGVQTGFETAEVRPVTTTPPPTVVAQPAPPADEARVAGTRQQPRPAPRRVIRGRW